MRRLEAQGLASPRVVATNDLRDAGPPVVASRGQWSGPVVGASGRGQWSGPVVGGVEVAGTAQLKGLVEPGLQMPMAAFDRAVLMGPDLEAGPRLLRVGSMP